MRIYAIVIIATVNISVIVISARASGINGSVAMMSG